jgi:hypothetical protein
MVSTSLHMYIRGVLFSTFKYSPCLTTCGQGQSLTVVVRLFTVTSDGKETLYGLGVASCWLHIDTHTYIHMHICISGVMTAYVRIPAVRGHIGVFEAFRAILMSSVVVEEIVRPVHNVFERSGLCSSALVHNYQSSRLLFLLFVSSDKIRTIMQSNSRKMSLMNE